jgi:microsomal dipeptidase-like Zn-dependent dipeptidase
MAPMAGARDEMLRPFPLGLEDVTRLDAFRHGLDERGYSGSDVAKIMGGNFERVLRAVVQ